VVGSVVGSVVPKSVVQYKFNLFLFFVDLLAPAFYRRKVDRARKDAFLREDALLREDAFCDLDLRCLVRDFDCLRLDFRFGLEVDLRALGCMGDNLVINNAVSRPLPIGSSWFNGPLCMRSIASL
jgi:hypothetical protein